MDAPIGVTFSDPAVFLFATDTGDRVRASEEARR